MAEQLGIALLGCGYWGINYARVFSELPNAYLAVVCDARTERLREVGHRFPETELTTSVEVALQKEGVQAAVVCTHATAHYDVAHQCLMAGKHTLVEKPMTLTTADSEALIALAESNQVTLMVGHTFLYNSAVRKVKEYITQKKVNQVYYLYARRTNLGPIRQDVNALWDLATHDVSIFNYLLDDTPQWVSAVGLNILNNHEDVGFVSVGYSSGIVGHIHASWVEPNKVREIVVVGDNMRIVFDDIKTLEQVRVFEKGVTPAPAEAASYGEFRFGIRDGDIISPKIEVSEPLKNQCSHFLDCIKYGYRPLTGGQEGLMAVQVLTAINQSIAQRGAPVDITGGVLS